ncbi:peptidylprolyl isomerase [Paenibacillus humicola]|uniref:peptidylprolyl isomerase n=1 Tax=Paenibacillus humicola TaxID=3110540 RepID=UPI00237B8474|nr:peptidylprolyl isomerase [Paenibacillus humicola]
MLRINHRRKGVLLLLAAVLAFALAGCGKKQEEAATPPPKDTAGTQESSGTPAAPPKAGEGKTIATYKDGDKTGTVTDKEFDQYTAFFVNMINPQAEMYFSIPQLKEQFLREYIGYKILSARLTQDKRDAVKADADNFYNQVKTAEGQQADLKKKLDDAGLTEGVIKYYFSMVQAIQKDEESKVTDADIKKLYDADPKGFSLVTLRHILIMTKDPQTGEEKHKDADALKIAKEVKAKLDKGGDWNALAKQYSEDPGSKDKGGLYENVEPRLWVAGFKDAALSQPIGKVGDPVKSDYGYHVIEVEKRAEQPYDKLPQSDKDELKQTATQNLLNDFMTNELPKLITKIDLPQEPAPNTGGTANPGSANQGAGNTGASNQGAAQSGNAAKK